MEKINIAELLRDCPTGMELDCTVFDNITFDYVNTEQNRIYCKIDNRDTIWFTVKGCINFAPSAKCVIFPKGKTTWEGFQRPFKDGDIVTWKDRGSLVAFIYKERKDIAVVKHHFALYTGSLGTVTTGEISLVESEIVFATEEEKQKLFDAIKANGYRWNPDTKTLSKLPKFKKGDTITNNKLTIKITHVDDKYYYSFSNKVTHSLLIESQDEWKLVTQPKFKKGDKVRVKGGVDYRTIKDVCETFYTLIPIGKIDFTDQDNWELVIEPIFKIKDVIKHICGKERGIIEKITDEGYKCRFDYGDFLIPFKEQHNFELALNKFDINTLKPFDKVLVRTHHMAEWKVDFFSHYTEGADFPYNTVGNSYRCYCIPFRGNEYLRGTTDDCNNFYKTWEE